jgi:hypothetical protein
MAQSAQSLSESLTFWNWMGRGLCHFILARDAEEIGAIVASLTALSKSPLSLVPVEVRDATLYHERISKRKAM